MLRAAALKESALSEFQYHEFLAVDRPLTADDIEWARTSSSRAEITATSFTNTYEWGDFRGDPDQFMSRCFDAHLYYADWGTRRLMLRLPHSVLAAETVEPYTASGDVQAWHAKGHTVIDLHNDYEPGEDYEEPEGRLAEIIGIREELATGDMRPLYLAWLASYGRWEHDEAAFDLSCEDDPEPPVPAGLSSLTPSQRALADFLSLDADLLAVAAEASSPLESPAPKPAELREWVSALEPKGKDRLLARVMGDEAGQVRLELLRRLKGNAPVAADAEPRTVAVLLDAAAARRNR
jgi:hypothetical protein